MGFQTVEIPVEDPSHIDPAQVKAQLDRHGLVADRSVPAWGLTATCAAPRAAADRMRYLKQLIDQMVVLDCPSLIGPVYSAVGRADAVRPRNTKNNGGPW